MNPDNDNNKTIHILRQYLSVLIRLSYLRFTGRSLNLVGLAGTAITSLVDSWIQGCHPPQYRVFG